MRPALQVAKGHLGLHPGVPLRHVYSTADKSTIAKVRHFSARRTTVDHVIFLADSSVQNLVTGLGRPSSKWSGRMLVQDTLRGKPAKELVWPVRQLANICALAGTRYGYLHTDEELVVCCFIDVTPPRAYEADGGMRKQGKAPEQQETFKAYIMPISWSCYGAEVLTSGLALWWLCMLAMSPHQPRHIARENEIVRICEWDILHLDEERGWVRRHRYSGLEEPADAPPPPVTRRRRQTTKPLLRQLWA
jgi:hypothetical protein